MDTFLVLVGYNILTLCVTVTFAKPGFAGTFIVLICAFKFLPFSCLSDSYVYAFHFTGLQYDGYVNNQASCPATPLSSSSDDEEEDEEDEEAGRL